MCLEELWNLSLSQDIFIRHLNENREILRDMPPNLGHELCKDLMEECREMQRRTGLGTARLLLTKGNTADAET